MQKSIYFSTAVLLFSIVPAFAIESNVSASSAAAPAAVWAKIGDFCGIGNWHPAIAKCTLSADGKNSYARSERRRNHP